MDYVSFYRRSLSEDRWIEVIPLTFGRARIIITDGFGVFNSY